MIDKLNIKTLKKPNRFGQFMSKVAGFLTGAKVENIKNPLPPEVEKQIPALMESYNRLLNTGKNNGDRVVENSETQIRDFLRQTLAQFQTDGTAEYMRDLVNEGNSFRYLAVPTGLTKETFADLMESDWHFGKILQKYSDEELSGVGGENGVRIIAITEKPVGSLRGNVDQQIADFERDKQYVGSLIEPNIADGFAYWNAKMAANENPKIRIIQSQARREQIGDSGDFDHVSTFRVHDDGEIDLGGATVDRVRETYRAVGRIF
ncbi:MAG: hypothetical protein LBM09_01290 [Candidatus Nomurabacteria bacterium]|jgi:hypothetical protein|nr:hypothetical protein [Candidatus Nomurabacteria bacterium]